MRFKNLSLLLLGVSGLATCGLQAATPGAAHAVIAEQPLYFEANRGQAEESIRFVARNGNAVFSLSPMETVITLRKRGASPGQSHGRAVEHRPSLPAHNVHIHFLGANPQAKMIGTGELCGSVNYFIGNDPGHWHKNVPIFGGVQVEEAYPGINVLHYGNQRQYEFDFVVAPGADPRAIAFQVSGADRVEIGPQGDLMLTIGKELIRQKKPVIYQVKQGHRVPIAGSYRLENNNTVFLRIDTYSPDRPLIIDPVLTYSTFLGGLGNETARSVVLDPGGNVYVAGDTLSSQLATADAYQPFYAGGYPNAGGDAFVAKFDPTGTNLLFLTYLGGSGDDAATSMALDQDGNIYLAGVTDSTNFPIPGYTFTNQISGKGELYFDLHPYDAFVAKLSGDGTRLIYATYLGGSGADQALAIVVDTNACAYLVGFTQSTNFPTTANAFQRTLQGNSTSDTDAFVTKISADGTRLVYSTYLGGTNTDDGESIAVDALGRAYVTGFTASTNFPVSPDAFQTNGPTLGPPSQVFVAILDANGESVLRSTYLGGLGSAAGFHLALDNSGNIYVTGSETGPGFPVTPGKLNPGGVFKSGDGAQDWAASNTGLLHNQVQSIGIDPVNTSNLYVGTGRGIARSVDGGATWLDSLDTFDQVLTFAVDPAQPSTVYAGATGVLKSTNSGISWFSSTNGLVPSVAAPTNEFATVRVILLDPGAPTNLYAATAAGVFKSTDGAATWRSANSGLKTTTVLEMVMDALDPGTLIVANSSGIFRSTNAAGSWKDFDQGLTNNVVATSLAADSAKPSTLYLGRADGSLYKRGPADTNWILLQANLIPTNNIFSNAVPLKSITLLVGDPVTPSTLYAGTHDGLLKSVDGGNDWSFVTNGLPSIPVAALAIDPASPTTLYAGLYNSFAGSDAFVTKFTPDLTSVIYSVVFGGSSADEGIDLALDAAGDAFVVGTTSSLDFPTYQPIDYASSFNHGLNDAFVTALRADGSDFLFSTYLGGLESDTGIGIALDSATNVWVVGQTASRDFPTLAAYQSNFRAPSDAFLARISPTNSMVNATFQTDPPGIGLFVDGVTNVTPVTLHWAVGSSHTLAAISQPTGGVTNIQYAWVSWSDGGDLIHQVAAFGDTNFSASFKLQYFLTTGTTNITATDTNLAWNATNSGAVSPVSAWFDAGTNVTISAIAPYSNNFAGWLGEGNGSISNATNPAVITMNGPITEIASFSGPLTNLLKVVINGNGTVSPNLNGHLLTLGKVYTLTAQPQSGSIFSNWVTGNILYYNPKISFVMTNGIVLQANFVTNPFVPIAGTYAGLFYDTNITAFVSSGFLSATITTLGKVSAKLMSSGRTYSFSGQLSSLGTLTVLVARSGLPSASVTIQADLTGATNVLTGLVTSAGWAAGLVAVPAVYSNTNPPPLAGNKYTLLLPGAPASITEPAGDGYGTVSIDKVGNITFSGKMGDGNSVSQKTFLSGLSQWPFYITASTNNLMFGWLAFTNEPDSDISGPLNWFKIPAPFTTPFPSGFSLEPVAVGSLYTFSNGVPVLPLNQGNGRLVLENGGLARSFTNFFTLNSANMVTTTNKTSLTINTGSGVFQGSAVDPATGKSISFRGAVLQKRNRGSGFFRNTDQAGRASIGP
jgi:hypothetical protein